MDMMFWMELAVVIIAIFIGAKWGGAGLGAAGGIGLGVLVFGFGMQPGAPPVSVLLIITAVITCASILQGSGGLDFLVSIAEKLLRRNPKNITFMGPLVCYLFTLFCGTAYVAFSVYPVIAEVAIGARVRPERPLTMSVIGAQSGITGSPMSAATGAMIALLAVKGVTPLQIFSVAIPACLLGVLIGCAFMFKKGKELADDPEFQRRVMSGEFQDKPINTDSRSYSSSAKKGVIVFALGILAVVFFGSFPDLMPSWEKAGKVTRLSIPNMVQIVMLCCAGLIMVIANVSPKKLADGSVFRSGLIGMVAVYGVSWLTATFFNFYKPMFVAEFGNMIQGAPILFAVALFILSAVLFSQGATVTALVPMGIGLGISPADLVWMFPAVSGYFMIPAGGAIIGCVAFDRTGTTQIGKFVFNHSYMLPGIVTSLSQLTIGYVISKFVF